MTSLYKSGWTPRGVRKDWERTSVSVRSAQELIGDWGDSVGEVTEAVAWFRPDDSLAVLVTDHYDGRRLVLRQDGRGDYKVTFTRTPK